MRSPTGSSRNSRRGSPTELRSASEPPRLGGSAGEVNRREGTRRDFRPPRPPRSSDRDLLQHRVDAREAALRTLLDAVLHGRVALLGGGETHRLRQPGLLAEILELQRLQVVLERLHEPLGRLDLAELALDDAERRAEPVRAARADVHLLDDCPLAPPLGDQLRVRPDREDVRPRRVEDPLDADLELVRRGDGGLVHVSSPPARSAFRSVPRPPWSASSSARTRPATSFRRLA